MILVCWKFVIVLEFASEEWEKLEKEVFVEKMGYSEDQSKVVFPWAGPGTGHLCNSAGFQLFLVEYLWLGLCLGLFTY